MTFGVRMLQLFFPKQEAQRMELRRVILEASACAEDLQRTLKEQRAILPNISKMNGTKKEM